MFINDTELHYLNKKDSKLLINSISNLKHKLIVLIMLDAGLRVSECITLKLSNFDFRGRRFKVKSLKKRDKATKEKYRVIPLSARLYNCLADYLYKFKLSEEDFLFPSAQNETGHITRFAVNKFLDRYKNKLNIKQLHPHTLRHTCATSHLANGADLIHIKEILGHENLNTTTIYSHVPDEILRANIEKATYEERSLFNKFKFFLFGKSKDQIISIPTKRNLPAIGRTSEIQTISSFLNREINTIILGDIGAGKSHLLKMVTPEQKVLKLDDCDNIKKSLIYLLIYLFENEKKHVHELIFSDFDMKKTETKLNRESIPNLCEEVKKLVEPKEYTLVIDSVDRITPRAIKALEVLKDTFTILCSAREIPLNKSSFLWNFEIIKLKPLDRSATLDLVHKLSYDLDVEDYELFKNHIWEQSNGNPRVIYEIIERYRKEPVITSEVVRDIRHFGSMKEFDMSLLIIIFLASLAILRYLSREVDNDSYRFIGGVAMVLLVISRYFFQHMKRKHI